MAQTPNCWDSMERKVGTLPGYSKGSMIVTDKMPPSAFPFYTSLAHSAFTVASSLSVSWET